MLFDEFSGNLLAIASIKEEEERPKKKKMIEPNSGEVKNKGGKKKLVGVLCNSVLTEE